MQRAPTILIVAVAFLPPDAGEPPDTGEPPDAGEPPDTDEPPDAGEPPALPVFLGLQLVSNAIDVLYKRIVFVLIQPLAKTHQRNSNGLSSCFRVGLPNAVD